jgi:alpha-D-ribose 1-methylphosphonate 5-triphosphate diphosphatase PhnM
VAAGKRADFVRVRESPKTANLQSVPVPMASWRQGLRIA